MDGVLFTGSLDCVERESQLNARIQFITLGFLNVDVVTEYSPGSSGPIEQAPPPEGQSYVGF